MTTWVVALAAGLVRAWTRAYTWRLPAAARDARRAEIESDLWELEQDRVHARLHPAAQIAARWLLGMPDDLAWRCAQRPVHSARRVALTLAAVSLVILMASLWLLPLLLPARLPVPPNMMRFAAHPPPPPPESQDTAGFAGRNATSPKPTARPRVSRNEREREGQGRR